MDYMHEWKFLVEPVTNDFNDVVYWHATPIKGAEKPIPLMAYGNTPEDAVFNARRKLVRWVEDGERDGEMA